MKWKRLTTLGVLCALLVATAVVSAAPMVSVDWRVVGSGGAHLQAGGISVDNALAQPVARLSSAGDADLCAGFWCQVIATYKAYIPLILRGYSD